MIQEKEVMPPYLAEESKIGDEISITGKWVPLKKGGIFRKTAESKEMIKEWEDIHVEAKAHDGILSTEINHAVGQDAILVHHVFKNSTSLIDYFSKTATEHAEALFKVAKPEMHFVRGTKISDEVRQAIKSKNVPVTFGEYLYGFVRNDYQQPDPKTTIQVTAKWICESEEDLDELIYWWQKVGTDAYNIEKGLVRYEAFKAIGEPALIIHDTFENSDVLQFHLSKGTAAMYKKHLDKIAAPENYFFRGPVAWMIRTYSKFMRLPATYTGQGSNYMIDGGNMSDGLK